MFRTELEAHSKEEVRLFVEKHRSDILPKLKYLKDYYKGEHEILNKTIDDPSKPNNKLVNNYSKYITDMNVGYFVGVPISYTNTDDKLMKALDEINDYNDEQLVNLEIAKEASIAGLAYEVLYSDKDSKPRFKKLDAKNTFVVRDNTLEDNIVYGVYYRVTKDAKHTEIIYADVYETNKIYHYSIKAGNITLDDEEEHFFGDVPINPYFNNEEHMGDFATVISLIDGYNKTQSNTLDDMDQFTDAYLMLKDMNGTTSDDVKDMKNNRILLVDEKGDAKWLVKDINDAWVENYKTRLDEDIHKFSNTPALDSNGAAGSKTTIEIKMKLLGMEQNRVNKERYFKKSLQRRIEMLVNFLNIKGANYDYLTVKPVFTANIPQNAVELAALAKDLVGVVSDETLLSNLPMVEDVQEEMKRKKQEDAEKEEKFKKLIPINTNHTNLKGNKPGNSN
ncbi:phage portal protein [Bacillus sp. AFS001701]|uniref:phage portal protein n=1 Tax=Bacillus sp. AFS001701 TaxID=2033480 RepID=UPI0015966A07|nr:phage portal protein [Bacillus sp. AFS001701]